MAEQAATGAVGRSTLDPVTLAILAGRLEQITAEMDSTLFRSAFNPIIAEAHDACHGIYDAGTGDALVQGPSGLPIFVGTMSFAVRAVIERAARRGDLCDGDIYAFTDAYVGGTHLNDVKLVRPYFRGGRLFCFLGSVAHWNDVGGNVPGGYNPEATETFQEGVRIPPVKLFDGGRRCDDIVDIFQSIGRLPDFAYGDLHAQLAALDLGSARMDALLAEYGDDVVANALSELSASAERLMRAYLADLPDGTYVAEDQLDNDGISDRPLRIAVAATIAGDRLTLDFSDTDPACTGPLNMARSSTIAACYVALKHTFPDVPANAGCLRPIEWVIPDGSLLAAESPRPVGGYTETLLRVIDVIFAALAQAAPHRAMGASYGTINALCIAGHRADGRRWVMFNFHGGGLGGNPEGDGLSHGSAPLSTAIMPPVEVLEAAYPVRYTSWALRPDSGGPGAHRGGLGAVYEVELLADGAELFFFSERASAPPPGVHGGRPGARNVMTYGPSGTEHRPELRSKLRRTPLRAGDRIRIESPGGGGFGPPAERTLEQVAEDVRLGYVSRAAAERDYGVTFGADGRPSRVGDGSER